MSRPNPLTSSNFGRQSGASAAPTRSSVPAARAGLDFWKTLGVTVLFLFSVVVLFVVLQVTGLWDWLNPLTCHLASTSVLAPHVEMYRLGREDWRVLQDEKARLATWEAELQARAERLAEQEDALKRAQDELEQERARAAAWEAELMTRQAAVERLEDEQRALERVRELYEEMRPQEAARILADMSDDEVARLLDDMDPRTASAILSALPIDKAVVVSRLLGL